MADEPNGVPQGQTPPVDSQQQQGGPPAGGDQPPQDAPNRLEKFMVDGKLDSDKLAEAYTNLESEYGRRNNELGEVRKKATELETWQKSHVEVMDPNTGIKYLMPREQYEQYQARARQAQGGQQQELEQVKERLSQLQYEDPIEYANVMAGYIRNIINSDLSARERAYSDPVSQRVLAQYPEVRDKAEQYRSTYGVPHEDALDWAIGRKVRELTAQGITPNGDIATPNAVTSLHNQDKTFMQPGGQIPTDQKPKSKFTEAQKEFYRSRNYDWRELEPYAEERK